MTAAAKAAFLRFLLCYCLTLHMCDVTIILIQCFFCFLPFLIFQLSLRGKKKEIDLSPLSRIYQVMFHCYA